MEKQDFDHNSTEINEQKPSVEIMQAEIIRRICFREYPPGSQLKRSKASDGIRSKSHTSSRRDKPDQSPGVGGDTQRCGYRGH